MEIERKYLVGKLPDALKNYECKKIEQAYLNTFPVVRVRRSDDEYYMTYKGGGKMIREEYNLPLNRESYEHLVKKADGNVITKTRYLIPLTENPHHAALELVCELDVFEGAFQGIVMAEVEFPTEAAALSFEPPVWFVKEVTQDQRFHNSFMSTLPVEKIRETYDL